MLLNHSWDAMPIIYICWMKQMISTITYVVGLLYGKHFTYIISQQLDEKGEMVILILAWEIKGSLRLSNFPNQDHKKPSIWVCTLDYAYVIFKIPVITWPLCIKWMTHICGPNSVAHYPFLVVSKITFSALWPTTSYTHSIHIPSSTASIFRCLNKQLLCHAPCLSSPTYSLLSCNCIQLHRPVSNIILMMLSPYHPVAALFFSRLSKGQQTSLNGSHISCVRVDIIFSPIRYWDL